VHSYAALARRLTSALLRAPAMPLLGSRKAQQKIRKQVPPDQVGGGLGLMLSTAHTSHSCYCLVPPKCASFELAAAKALASALPGILGLSLARCGALRSTYCNMRKRRTAGKAKARDISPQSLLRCSSLALKPCCSTGLLREEPFLGGPQEHEDLRRDLAVRDVPVRVQLVAPGAVHALPLVEG